MNYTVVKLIFYTTVCTVLVVITFFLTKESNVKDTDFDLVGRIEDVEDYILKLKCDELNGITLEMYKVSGGSTLGCKLNGLIWKPSGINWILSNLKEI